MRSACFAAGALLAFAVRAIAQVTASQATPALTEVPSPMQLDIVIPASVRTLPLFAPARTVEERRAMQRPGWKRPGAWRSTETAAYACDRARVEEVWVGRAKGSGKKLMLEAGARLSTGWFRQDIDLTITLLIDGREVRRETWDDLTIGVEGAASKVGAWGSSSSKEAVARWSVTEEEVAAWFAEGASRKLRIVVDIEE